MYYFTRNQRFWLTFWQLSKKFKKLHFQSLIRQNSHSLYVRICPHMEEYMNYYNEIKNELINNEITKKVKDYSKNRSDLSTYYNVGKLLSEAVKAL